MAKRVDLGKFWKPKDFGQTVLPDRSLLIRQKVVENAKVEKIEMRHFQSFSNTVVVLSARKIAQIQAVF